MLLTQFQESPPAEPPVAPVGRESFTQAVLLVTVIVVAALLLLVLLETAAAIISHRHVTILIALRIVLSPWLLRQKPEIGPSRWILSGFGELSRRCLAYKGWDTFPRLLRHHPH